jgi:glycolate oxidase FAD binding subunit
VDLIQPVDKVQVADELRRASAKGKTVMPIGGRQHLGRSGARSADIELSTTAMNEVIEYEPAEMIAVVQAGMRVGDLSALLAESGQEWAVDAPNDATVGGVIASGVSSPRRLRVGLMRDTVVELELATGDGRLIRSGARTVKNVTGYDIHKLATGSMGSLGVIVQVALKVRPLPRAARTLHAEGDGLRLGTALLDAVPMAAGVAATPGAVEIRLEGWPEEVDELEVDALKAVPTLERIDPEHFPSDGRGWASEVCVAPSQISELVKDAEDWTALIGVGLVWFRGERIGEPVGRDLPAPQIHARLKRSFDPAGILPAVPL